MMPANLLRALPLRLCLAFLLALVLGLRPAHAQQLYTVSDGQLTYDGHRQASAVVLVDGTIDPTREFFLEFMKNTYRLPFKASVHDGQVVLTARPATSAFAGRSAELVAFFSAATDSTTQVSLTGILPDDSRLTPEATQAEYQLLRQTLVRYAPAARAHTYQQQVADAESEVAAADKEKDQLTRSLQATRQHLDELQRQRQAETTQLRQDSVKLAANTRRSLSSRQLVQRRRSRLATLAPSR